MLHDKNLLLSFFIFVYGLQPRKFTDRMFWCRPSLVFSYKCIPGMIIIRLIPVRIRVTYRMFHFSFVVKFGKGHYGAADGK